jgi:hypothetical protein
MTAFIIVTSMVPAALVALTTFASLIGDSFGGPPPSGFA